MTNVNQAPNFSDKNLHNLVKELSSYGLGVCLPHAHADDGTIIELESDMVSVEQDLKVSFLPKNKAMNENLIPVAWRWNNNEIQTISKCCIGPTSEETP